MIEGLALADAEAAHGAGSTTVAPLVAAAVDKTLTQAFAGESGLSRCTVVVTVKNLKNQPPSSQMSVKWT